MAFAEAILARDEIVVGKSYRRTLTLKASPAFNGGDSDLAGILTDGATATVSVVDTDPDATEILAMTATVTAATRTVVLTATAVATAALVPGLYRWRATVTTTAGVFPIAIVDRPQVREIP